ncbi:hypothetical protein K438DRAFT_1966902 [Mycena galopus ATCC 62051]|nr:hypothetical protein K438DRAFT_1966902 [Mycena galopus ATCC 62051]
MAIPSASIVDLATPIHKRDAPGIQEETRDRLEWTWGLGHGHLDKHLQEFVDPQGILTDESLLIFPRNDIIHKLSSRGGQSSSRRPHIQKLYEGCKTFEYLVMPLDSANILPARILTSEVPPHLVVCTTIGKMLKAWAAWRRRDWDAGCVLLVERTKAVPHNGRPALGPWQLTQMESLHGRWTWTEYVPPSFLSEDSDQTMVEPEEEHHGGKRKSTHSNSDAEASSSGSRHEPKRRLLPSELQRPPIIRLFPSVDSDEDTDADEHELISNDSHVSGIDGDPEEFAKASMARGDYEVDRKWLKGIRRWAAKASKADADETLLNDEQIKEDSREQPRDATSLDLGKPDYLRRHKQHMAV